MSLAVHVDGCVHKLSYDENNFATFRVSESYHGRRYSVSFKFVEKGVILYDACLSTKKMNMVHVCDNITKIVRETATKTQNESSIIWNFDKPLNEIRNKIKKEWALSIKERSDKI